MSTPFKAHSHEGRDFFAVTAEDRIRHVKTFDRAQCEAALAMSDLQKTVERAVRSRMLILRKAAEVTATHYAWSWASGLIETGPTPPEDVDGNGVIVFARGRPAALERVLNQLARIGYGGEMLVPGVPEASTGRQKVDALGAWVDACAQRNGRADMSDVVFGRRVHMEVM